MAATSSTQAISLNANDVITVAHDQPRTTSVAVAETFGRLHKNVIQKIEALDCSAEFTSANFSAHVQTVEAGNGAKRKSKVYEMTKDGFMFLVMGFTGKKAAAIKEAYINAFNQMAAQLEQQRRSDPPALPAAEADRARRMALGQPLLNDAVRAEIDRQAQLLSSRTAPHYRNRLLTEALKTFPDSSEMIPTLAETIWANEQNRDEIDGIPVAWMREGFELCVSWLTDKKSTALPEYLRASRLAAWEMDMERFARHFEADWS